MRAVILFYSGVDSSVIVTLKWHLGLQIDLPSVFIVFEGFCVAVWQTTGARLQCILITDTPETDCLLLVILLHVLAAPLSYGRSRCPEPCYVSS